MKEIDIIELLKLSRKLEDDKDYEIYDIIEKGIFHERKMYPLEVYLYGFDDSVLGDSFIDNYYE